MTIYKSVSTSSATVSNPTSGKSSGPVFAQASAEAYVANEAVLISEKLSIQLAIELANGSVARPDEKLVVTDTHTESVVTIVENEIPNIVGQWNSYVKVIREEKPNQKPTFDYKYSEYPVTIEQNGKFVILTSAASPPLRPVAGYQVGSWHKVYYGTSFFWELNISDYDDNGVFKVTISKIENGVIKEMTGNYTESGFSATNPDQLPTNGEYSLTRL